MAKYIHGEEKIAFAVGGTGGHVLPAMELARNLPGDGKRVLVGVGIPKNAFISHREFRCFHVDGANFSKGVFFGAKQIYHGVKQAIVILQKENITHVVGMGGFHSLPVLIGAMILQIPFTLYEPNLIPGKINKIFSFFSKRTLILFQEVNKHLYGNTQLIHLQTKNEKKQVRTSKKLLLREFGLEENVTTILVFGGSMGAVAINELIGDAVSYIQGKVQIIHCTGACKKVKGIYQNHGVKAYTTTFLKEMHKAWQACDFAVCRAGAGSIKDAIIHKVPVLLIPYPKAVKNHQAINANFMERVIGGGKKLDQEKLCGETLAGEINQLCCHKVREKMIMKIENYTSNRRAEYVDGILL